MSAPNVCVIVPFYSEFETAKPGLRELRTSAIVHTVRLIQGALIANNRNVGVNSLSQRSYQSLSGYFSHYLFVDSDIGFKVDDVFRLLSYKKPIVGCPYLRHHDKQTYQAGVLDGLHGRIEGFYSVEKKGMCPVSFLGAGFLLVQEHALERMQYPWFRYGLLEWDDCAENVGEDVGFCLNARQSGIDIYCDFDHPVYHKSRKPEDFDVSY